MRDCEQLRTVCAHLCLAVLGEWLTTNTTSKLAVEDKVLILQILILCAATLMTNLSETVTCHSVLAVGNGSPRATTHLGSGTGHTAEMAATARQRTDSGNLLGTT